MDEGKRKIVNTLIEHILHENEENKSQWIEALNKLNSGSSKTYEMNYYKNIDTDLFQMVENTTELFERFVSETKHIVDGGKKKKSQKFYSCLKLLIALAILLAAGFAVGYYFYPVIDKILDVLLFSKKI